MSRPRTRDVEWADGIRGIASMFIVTSHCVRAFIPHYLSPADEYNGTPHLFQRPYFRMIASGPFWTSIFFLLSGYVCAIKPLRLANAGQADEARRVIASSGFRRVFRIGLPATLGTMFAWALAQMGAFETVGPIDFWADWLPHTTPHQVRGFYGGLRALVMQCFNTWATTENWYEGNQWTLSWEMRGSMLVFLVISLTASCTPFWRRCILILTAYYYFKSGEFLGPFLFFSGAILADIYHIQRSYTPPKMVSDYLHSGKPWVRIVGRYWPISLAMFAFLLASVPPDNAHYVEPSRFIWYFFDDHITTRWGETDRTIAAFAGIFLIFSILFSPTLRRFFSQRPFVWLGSISFPLYLLHGTFIRLPLVYILFKFLPRFPSLNIIGIVPDWEDIDVIIFHCWAFKCKFVVGVVWIVWLFVLLVFCRLWKEHVDILGVQFSRFAEDVALGKRDVSLGGWLGGRMESFGNGIGELQVFGGLPVYASSGRVEMNKPGGEKVAVA